jgi:flagellar biosynthetic protein FliR
MGLEAAFGFDYSNWGGVILTFLRVVTILFFLPIFGTDAAPLKLRIVLAMVITFTVWPAASQQLVIQDAARLQGPTGLFVATLREVFFGFAIGFSTKLVLVAASIAANMIGLNMGFQTAATFSPIFDSQDSAFAVFKNWIVIILILSLNLHHTFLDLIFRSFTKIPITGSINSSQLLNSVIAIAQTCFELGLKLAAPFLAVQFLSTLALGLLGRVVPQLNVFIINFPISYLVSMVLLIFVLGSMAALITQESATSEIMLSERTMNAFGGGR